MAKSDSGPKLTVVTRGIYGGECYRGDKNMQWRIGKIASWGKVDRIVEEYAVRCKCGSWWGWTYLIRANKILERLQKKGCPRCKKPQ